MMAQLQLGRRGGRTGGGLVGSHTPRQRIFTSAARTLRSGERAGRHATVHNMPDDMRMRDIPANGGGGAAMWETARNPLHSGAVEVIGGGNLTIQPTNVFS